MSEHEATFERTADAALTALLASPSDDALDAWADPIGAAQALGALDGDRTTAILRAALELPAAGDGVGPDPAAPWWLRVTRGSAEIRLGPAHRDEAGAAETRRVTRVVVDTAPLPDDPEIATARLSLLLDRKAEAPARVLVAEVWARSEELAVSRLRGLAGRLARVLSVPASLPAGAAASGETAGESDGADGAAAGSMPPQVSARTLARFTLRVEGPRLVLRDFASRGPRERASLNFAIGLAFAALAAGAWALFAHHAGSEGATAAASLAWLGGGVLLTLAAVAFLGVAQFARRYVATSTPLIAIGAGKLTVAPWVSRRGAVMLEPEGRFGAAIDLGEVSAVSVQDRKGRHALEVATEHGPIDALVSDDPTIARYLAVALGRALDDLRPESGGPSARQRARKRAAPEAKSS